MQRVPTTGAAGPQRVCDQGAVNTSRVYPIALILMLIAVPAHTMWSPINYYFYVSIAIMIRQYKQYQRLCHACHASVNTIYKHPLEKCRKEHRVYKLVSSIEEIPTGNHNTAPLLQPNPQCIFSVRSSSNSFLNFRTSCCSFVTCNG